MNAIVVVDRTWAIGRDGDLLFSLPTDMKRFRALTLGGTVILGRKTLESFPGGRPLPKRRNLVVSRRQDLPQAGYTVFPSPQAAADACQEVEDVWVIGGGSIYAALLPRCQRVFLTRVDGEAAGADTFFPDLDALPNWTVEHLGETVRENGMTYQFIEYVNTAL